MSMSQNFSFLPSPINIMYDVKVKSAGPKKIWNPSFQDVFFDLSLMAISTCLPHILWFFCVLLWGVIGRKCIKQYAHSLSSRQFYCSLPYSRVTGLGHVLLWLGSLLARLNVIRRAILNVYSLMHRANLITSATWSQFKMDAIYWRSSL